MNPMGMLRAIQDFAASPHGREAASSGAWDWLLLTIAVLSVATAFALCLRFLVRPGESDPEHIKRQVLQEDAPDRHEIH